MGAKGKRQKPPKVKKATITEDGCLLIDLGVRVYPNTTQLLITPEALLAIAEEYAEIHPADFNDYPGVPFVDEEDIFEDDEDEEDGEAEEKKPGEEGDPVRGDY